MNLVNATYTEMSAKFGQHLDRKKDPVSEAAEWLWTTHTKQRTHAYVKVQACHVPALEPTGVARIDKMLKADCETGFMSGNVGSNLQSSLILPAWNEVEVNGFKEFDGVKIQPGDLFKKALEAFRKSSWKEAGDDQVLNFVETIGKQKENESMTLVSVHHMRDAGARSTHKVPVIKHGWLLVGALGAIHYRSQTNWSPVSSKLMARAVMSLSCERYNSKDLLTIEDGKFTHVDQSVLTRLSSEGRDISKIDLSHRVDLTEPQEADEPLAESPQP